MTKRRRKNNEEENFSPYFKFSIVFGVTGCSSQQSDIEPTKNDINKYIDLVVISEDYTSTFGDVSVAYDRNTGVMYFIKKSVYQFGISPIYNSDGTVKLYEE